MAETYETRFIFESSYVKNLQECISIYHLRENYGIGGGPVTYITNY